MTQITTVEPTPQAKAEARGRNLWTLVQVLVGVLTGPPAIEALNGWLGTRFPELAGIVSLTALAALVKNFVAIRVGDADTATIVRRRDSIEVTSTEQLRPAPTSVDRTHEVIGLGVDGTTLAPVLVPIPEPTGSPFSIDDPDVAGDGVDPDGEEVVAPWAESYDPTWTRGGEL